MKKKIVAVIAGIMLIGIAAVGVNRAAAGNRAVASNSSAAGSEGEVTVVRAVTTGSPAPYMTVDENNELQGSDIEIIRAVFDRLPQYDLQIEVSSDGLTGLLSGQYQIAVNNYGWRDERGETYYYSLPYKTGYDVFIQRIGDEPLTGLQDLADRGYKV